MRSTTFAIGIVIIVLASVTVVSFLLYFNGNLFNSNPASSSQATIRFTIIEDSSGTFEGMNGSAYHTSANWPVIHAQKGDTVVIHVENVGTTEPHGFAIDHYFAAGVALSAGGSYNLTFVANQAGSFRMFCSIFCSIHPLMQNGFLIVS